MACVLSMPAFYQSQNNENITDIQNTGLNYLEITWISKGNKYSGLQDNCKYCGHCPMYIDNGTSKLCQLRIANGILGDGTQINTNVSDGQDFANGYNNGVRKSDLHMPSETSKSGIKRKTGFMDCGEVYIPAKRVSPFLNTPKERKDESRKLLKISMKKIKELDNPETFLRRSVLVNNLTKSLQTELREEKHVSRKFSSYNGKRIYDKEVLNNNCLSDIYLCDDPFLSGTHEAITDDMTDTLINNVLNDNQSNETKGGYDS